MCCMTPVVIYVKVDDQCDIVVVVNSKIKVTTHAPVDIQSPEFKTKFQKKVSLFLEISKFSSVTPQDKEMATCMPKAWYKQLINTDMTENELDFYTYINTTYTTYGIISICLIYHPSTANKQCALFKSCVTVAYRFQLAAQPLLPELFWRPLWYEDIVSFSCQGRYQCQIPNMCSSTCENDHKTQYQRKTLC